MIKLKIDRMSLINKIIEDNRKYIVRDFVKRGVINQIEAFEYCNYASDEEMLDILGSRKSCYDFISVMKLNNKWFNFVFDRYVKKSLDIDILEALVDNQGNNFDIEKFDFLDYKAPIYKDRLLSCNTIKTLNGALLGALNDRKLVPDSIIYEMNDEIARAISADKKFEDGTKLDTMQVIMFLRKLKEEEIDYYVNLLRTKSGFVYQGGMGILLCTQQVKQSLITEAFDNFSIELPRNESEVNKISRWLRGVLRNQNLDNIMDLVLDKINHNEFLIEEILRYNKVTSTKVLLKLVVVHKNIAYKYMDTAYPVLETHIF